MQSGRLNVTDSPNRNSQGGPSPFPRRLQAGRVGGGFTPNRKGKMINQYVIVRTYSAGVFAGTLVQRNGKEVELKDARRLWYWAGAASLSQLAQSGTSRPKDCKFPEAVDTVILTESIEILVVTPKAKASIEAVPVWTS